MRLKKTLPSLDSTSAPSSPPSSAIPLPPNTLRKPKPQPTDALQPLAASSPRQPSTLKKASPSPRPMNILAASSRSSSSSSSSSSTTTTTTTGETSSADVVSLNDDPDLKPIVPTPSSSPTKLSQFTFRGWPVSRKPPSTFSPPPSRDGPTSAPHVNYWSSVSPTNPQSQALTPSSSSTTPSSSPSPTSPSSSSWSSSEMHRASSSSDASTSSSVYSVKVTAPTAPSFKHPFIPKRPYSAPVTIPPPPPTAPLSPDALLSTEYQRRRATANGILYQTIPEGVATGRSATTRRADHHPSSSSSHVLFSPAAPSSRQTSPFSEQGYAADNDVDSVGSDRSVVQAVTVVNDPDKYSLHIKLPGFNLNNLCIASRRDRSLLITADKFEDEVLKSARSSSASRRTASSSTTPSSSTASSTTPQPFSTPLSSTAEQGQEDPQRPPTPPERLAGHFERCVQFGHDAEPARASARFDGEVLVIDVPKIRTWADVDIVVRRNSTDEPATPLLAQVDKSPRSIALALGANAGTGGNNSDALSSGSGESKAVSPGAESTTSTTPEGEMTSGSSCTDTSEVPSPMSEDGSGSGLDEVSRRLDGVRVDGSDEEDDGDESPRRSAARNHHQLYAAEPPTPTFYPPHHPMSSYPFSPNKQQATGPSPIASWLSSTSARSRSRSPSYSSGSDSEGGKAAARKHFGIEDDLVTPTPQRMSKRRGPEQGTAAAANNHHAVSPRKDYFGFPLTPVFGAASSSSDAEKANTTAPPKSAGPAASSHSILKQRSPSRESSGISPSQSPSRVPLSLRRGSIASLEEDDVVEHMRISLPSPISASANVNPTAGSSSANALAGRTREQGMGRSAFFWKRRTAASGQGV